MSVHSAGIILYRFIESELQVMLVHPGGPFWAKKDDGAWSIPKGIYEKDEDPLAAAKREFREETGHEVDGMFIDLGEVKQPSRKIVHAWALKHDFDTSKIVSNLFSLEWPPHSGKIQQFPEVDRAQWFEVQEAREKILKGQRAFLERLIEQLDYTPESAGASHYFE
ncbi:NUDIX domain-containing protein [Nitrosomonas sp. Is37]|uniref:NUDIX domain-containing protein n=1 Tax=Nitrosomonas sp. Is37 TaxID=3080535 RepID=UPI00294AB5FE|nr:NUDIX domain-containing protein [Nitrosomonas sp. Is37]MDV6343780.1 NUDIX domain-containing protein [Nitrosomonas sp. Is37]